jgi:SanA protein
MFIIITLRKILTKKQVKMGLILSAGIVFISIIFLLWSYLSVQNEYKNQIYTMEEVPSKPVALVLGAGVYPGGVLSAVLEDRVSTAVELYRNGKIRKILMSGDNSETHYDEPTSMKNYAIKLGVPADDVVLDYAGFRTYDSFYRARDIFSLKDIIIVTQRYHLPRALYISNKLGVKAVGVPSDRQEYLYTDWYITREFIASVKAFIDVNITKPLPVFLGKKEKVF